jgi:hypothetical protein
MQANWKCRNVLQLLAEESGGEKHLWGLLG